MISGMLSAMSIASEERKRLVAEAQQDYDASIADAAERVKIQASIADRALQSLMFANGGALVALFSFVGSAHAMRFDNDRLKMAFAAFAIGLAASLTAHLMAFVSQDRYYRVSMLEARRAQRIIASGAADTDKVDANRSFRTGQVSYITGVIIFIIATACFVGGCGLALWAVIANG